ncbi:MAG: GNAT family N-acetyltransferase [Actinobacteria bacterium]|nr:GNAT family N-acetyltransferase [Actinomycetota bacterium]
MTIVVDIADRATPELVDAMARLIPQLSSSNPPPTHAELAAIIANDSCDVLIARDGDSIVGSLTLVVFPIPTGIRAWIEDVVVDESSRGKGVGEALNTFALQRARERGAKTVDLTSRPSREAANRLYQRLGFVARDTNVYRYTL